jgi:hypothetical protein
MGDAEQVRHWVPSRSSTLVGTTSTLSIMAQAAKPSRATVAKMKGTPIRLWSLQSNETRPLLSWRLIRFFSELSPTGGTPCADLFLLLGPLSFLWHRR